MGPDLHHFAITQHSDPVGDLDGGPTMRNQDGGASLVDEGDDDDDDDGDDGGKNQ